MRHALILILLSAPLLADEKEDVAKLSEALGHLIGKNIEQLNLPLDLNALAKGMQDEAAGKQSPLNAETCAEQIAALQEKQKQTQSRKNLDAAIAFLENNKNLSAIHQKLDGKLQYKIEREGSGAEVQSYHSPIVRFKARYLNGKTFGDSLGETPITLSEAIPGFRQGLLGMKEGEIRTLYVHPELGYGEQGQLEPNALLIFEVEVIRADGTTNSETVTPLDLLDTPPIR